MINYFSLTKGVDRKQFMIFAKGLVDIYGKPGHYYSPLDTISNIEEKKEYITNKSNPIHDIDLNLNGQLELLNHLKKSNKLIPFDNDKFDCLYHPDNKYFIRTDASILFNMIMYLKPKRIIEVGSGYSSALMLDTNRIYFDDSIEIKCIEPYPKRLLSLINKENTNAVQIHDSFVQDIDIAFFKQLDSNDILFIDSSHISKVLSDLNFIIFEVLPALKRGVYIHFHDIFFSI
jgi:predicted O-methyltransferase YrrM